MAFAILLALAVVAEAQLSAPIIKSVSPSYSSHTGGALLTIRGIALGDGFTTPRQAFVGSDPCDIIDFKSGPSQVVCVTRSLGGSQNSGWRDVRVVAGGVSSSCSGSCRHLQHVYYSLQLRSIYNTRSRADGTVGHRLYNRYATTDKQSELSIRYGDALCRLSSSSGDLLDPEDPIQSSSSTWWTSYCKKDPESTPAGFYRVSISATDEQSDRIAGNHYNHDTSFSIGPRDALYHHQSMPVVTSVRPRSLSRAGGANITILGVGFAPLDSASPSPNNNSVRVGGAPCRVVEATARRLVCTTQAQSTADLAALVTPASQQDDGLAIVDGAWVPGDKWEASNADIESQAAAAERDAAMAAVLAMEEPTPEDLAAASTAVQAAVAAANRSGLNASSLSPWNTTAANAAADAAALAARTQAQQQQLRTAQMVLSSASSVATAKRVVPGPWGVRYERFDNIDSTSLNALYSSAKWKQGQPSFVGLRREMSTPTNIGNRFGSVMAAIFYPDMDGDYTFVPRGDDDTRLYVTDPQPANSTSFSAEGMRELVARNSGKQLSLRRGEAVYMQLRHKEHSGGDFARLEMRRHNTSHNSNIAGAVDEVQEVEAVARVYHEAHALLLPDAGGLAVERGGSRTATSLDGSSFSLRLNGTMRVSVSTRGNATARRTITSAPISLETAPSASATAAASEIASRVEDALDALFTVPCTYSYPKGATGVKSFRTQSFETSADEWTSRNGVDPERRRTPYCGKRSMWTPRSYGRMFERNDQFKVLEHPFMCMAYRIPASTRANMLLLLNGTTWRSLEMTAPMHGSSYPAVGSWGIKGANHDGRWHYGCLNLLEQLTRTFDIRRARATTVQGIIWYHTSSGSAIGGSFEIDELHIGSHPRMVHRDEDAAAFFDASIDESAAADEEVFTLSSFTVSAPSSPVQVYDPSNPEASLPERGTLSSTILSGLPGTAPTAAAAAESAPLAPLTIMVEAASCERTSRLAFAASYGEDASFAELRSTSDSPVAATSSSSLSLSRSSLPLSLARKGSVPIGGSFEVAFAGSQPRLVSATSSDGTMRGHLLALGTTGSDVHVAQSATQCWLRKWTVTYTRLPGTLPLLTVSNRGNRLLGTDAAVSVRRLRTGYVSFSEVPDYLLRAALPTPEAVEVTVNGVGAWCDGGKVDGVCGAKFTNDATPVLEHLLPKVARAGDEIHIRGKRLGAVDSEGLAVNATVAEASEAILATVAGLACEPVYARCNDTQVVCTLTASKSADASAAAANRTGGVGVVIKHKGAAVASSSASLSFSPEMAVDSANPLGPLSVGGGAVVTIQGAGLSTSALSAATGEAVWKPPSAELLLFAPGSDPASASPLHSINVTVDAASYTSVALTLVPLVVPGSSLLAAGGQAGTLNASAVLARQEGVTPSQNASLVVAVRLSRPAAPGAAAATVLWAPSPVVPGGEAFVSKPTVEEVAETLSNRANAPFEAGRGMIVLAGQTKAAGAAKEALRLLDDKGSRGRGSKGPQPVESEPAPVAVARTTGLTVDVGSDVTPRVASVSPRSGSASGGVKLSVTGAGFGCSPRVWLLPVDSKGLAGNASVKLACPVLSATSSAVHCTTPPTPMHVSFAVVVECPGRGMSVTVNASQAQLERADAGGLPLHMPGASAAAARIAGYDARLVVSGISRPINRAAGTAVSASHPAATVGVSAAGGALFHVSGLGFFGAGGGDNITAQVRVSPVPAPLGVPRNILPKRSQWLSAVVEDASDSLAKVRLPSLMRAVPRRTEVGDALLAQALVTFDGADVQSLSVPRTSQDAPVFGVVRSHGASGQSVNGLAFPWVTRSAQSASFDLDSVPAVIPGRMGSSPVHGSEALRVQAPSWLHPSPKPLLNETQLRDLKPVVALPSVAGVTVHHDTLLNMPSFAAHTRVRLDSGVAAAAQASLGLDIIVSANVAGLAIRGKSTRVEQTSGYAVGINRCGRWEARAALQVRSIAAGGDPLSKSDPSAPFPGCEASSSEYEAWARRAQGFAVAVGPLAAADEERWVSVTASLSTVVAKEAVLRLYRNGALVGASNASVASELGGTTASFFSPLSFCEDVGVADVPYGCSLVYGVVPDSPGAAATSDSAAATVAVELDEVAVFSRDLGAAEVAYLHDSLSGSLSVELRVGAHVAQHGTVWAPCGRDNSDNDSDSNKGGCSVLATASEEAVAGVAWVTPQTALANEQVRFGLRPQQPGSKAPAAAAFTSQSFHAFAAGRPCSQLQLQAPGASLSETEVWASAGWEAVCRLDNQALIGSTQVTMRHVAFGDSVTWHGAASWRASQLAPALSPLVQVLPRVTSVSPHQLSVAGGAVLTLRGEAFVSNASRISVKVSLLQSSGYGAQGSGTWSEELVACRVISASASVIRCIVARPGAASFSQPSSWAAMGALRVSMETRDGEELTARHGCGASDSSASSAGTLSCDVRFAADATAVIEGQAFSGRAEAGANMDLTGKNLPTHDELASPVDSGIVLRQKDAITGAAMTTPLLVPRIELVPLTPGLPIKMCAFQWGTSSGTSLTCKLPQGINGAMLVRVVAANGLAIGSGKPLPRSEAWDPRPSGVAVVGGAPTVPSTVWLQYFTSMTGPQPPSHVMPLGGGGALQLRGTSMGGGMFADKVRLSGLPCLVDPWRSNASHLECVRPPMPPLAVPPHSRQPRAVAEGLSIGPVQGEGASRLRPASSAPSASNSWKKMGSWSIPTSAGAAGQLALTSDSPSFALPARCNVSSVRPHSPSARPSVALIEDHQGAAWTDATVSARVTFASVAGRTAAGLTLLAHNRTSAIYAVVWPRVALSDRSNGDGCAQIVAVTSDAAAPVVLASAPLLGLSGGTAANVLSASVSAGGRVSFSVNGERSLTASLSPTMLASLVAARAATAGVVAMSDAGASVTDVTVQFHGGASPAALPGKGLARLSYQFGEGGDSYVFDHPLNASAPPTRQPVRWTAEGSPSLGAVYSPAWISEGSRIALAGKNLLRLANATHFEHDDVVVTVGGSPCAEITPEGASAVAGASAGELNGQLALDTSTPPAVSAMLADSLPGRAVEGLELLSCIAPPLPAGRHRVRVWTKHGFVRATAPAASPEAATFDRLPATSGGSVVMRSLDGAAVPVAAWVEAVPRAELGSPAGGRAIVVAGWGLPAQEDAAAGGGVDVGLEVCGLPCVPLSPAAAVELTGVNATRAAAGLLPGQSVSTASIGPMSVHRALVCEMRGLRPLDRKPLSSHAVRIPLDASLGTAADLTQWTSREQLRVNQPVLEIAPDTLTALRFDPARALDADSALGSPSSNARADSSGGTAVSQASLPAPAIPRGAVIEEARLELVSATTGGSSFDLDVHIAAGADFRGLDLSQHRSLSRMWNTTTAGSAPTSVWRIKPFLAPGVTIASVDISHLLQQLVNSSAWPQSPSSSPPARRSASGVAGAYTPPVISLLLRAMRGNGTGGDDEDVAGMKADDSAVEDYDFSLDDDTFFPNGGLTYKDELADLAESVPARPYRRVYSGDALVDANGDGVAGRDEVAPVLFVRYRLPDAADAIRSWPAGDGTAASIEAITGDACAVRLTSLRSPAEEDAAQLDTKPQPLDPVSAFAEERHRRLSRAYQVDPARIVHAPSRHAVVKAHADVATSGQAPVRTCRSLGSAGWERVSASASISASSSLTEPGDATVQYRPEQAMDGRSTTYWLSQSQPPAEQWFQLEFARPVAVADVLFDWQQAPLEWKLLASVDSQDDADRASEGAADTPLAAGNESLSFVEVASSAGLPRAGTAHITPSFAQDYMHGLGGGVVARRLRLQLLRSGDSRWGRYSLRQFEVRGCPLRPVTASSAATADPVPPSQARRQLRRAAAVHGAGHHETPESSPAVRRLHAIADAMHAADGRSGDASSAQVALRGGRQLAGSAPAALPVITSISPRRGSTAGGTRLTIVGENFPSSSSSSSAAAASVWIGGRYRCDVESISVSKIVCVTADPKKAVLGKGSDALPVCIGMKRGKCRALAKELEKQGRLAGVVSEEDEASTGVESADAEATLLGAATTRSAARRESVEVNLKGFGNAIPSSDAVTFQYIDTWSATTTWGGRDPPVEGDSAVIPPGHRVLLDVSPPRLYALVVQGTLEFADDADISLDAHTIIVNGGVFQVGSEAEPFQHRATITLHGHPKQLEIPIYGTKVLAVRYGTLDLHGKRTSVPWTRLGLTARKGSNTIYLERQVGWRKGDLIAIASTGFSPTEAETRTIASVASDGRTVFLDRPLSHEHLGETVRFSRTGVPAKHGSPITSAEMRAEVSLLSRNVVIQGDETYSGGWVQYGAHVMLHSPGDETVVGRIEDVEFRRVGQAFRLGRYPVHFHMVGTVKKSYVRRVSVHKSFNRGITIHGVHRLRITENVLHDVMGHAIFVEDAIETDNVVHDNCITRVRASRALLNADMQPAGLWITNADQDMRRNVVSGSDGHGFWFKSETSVTGVAAASGMGANVCPQHSPLGVFSHNTAHSNGRLGLWLWEKFLPRRRPCDPTSRPKTAVFRRFTAWRNGMFGVAITDVSHVVFDRNVIMENKQAGFELPPAQGGALRGAWGDNRVVRSVIAGNVLMTGRTTQGVHAAADHGMLFDQVSFTGFTGGATALYGCSKCAKFTPKGGGWESRYRRIAWLDNDPNRFQWRWKHEGVYVDLDGTLTAPAPSRTATSTSQVLQAGRFRTVIPRNGLVDAAVLKDACSERRSLLGRSFAVPSVACDNQQWRRFALNNHQPQSLLYKSIIFTITDEPSQSNNLTAIRHSDLVAWDDKRKTKPRGYVATLPASLKLPIEMQWNFLPDQSDRVDIDAYSFDYSSPLKNELITIQHPYMITPNRFEVNGIDEPSEDAALSRKDRLGTWVWDDVTRHVTYALTTPSTPKGTRPFASSSFKMHRCPRGGCVTVPACDLADRKGKSRGTQWLKWSEDSTWEILGWEVGTRPRDGDNVTIPWEFNLILDEDTLVLETLIIAGRVRFGTRSERSAAALKLGRTFDPSVPLRLTALRVIVRHEGRLSAGARGLPHDGSALIRLVGDRFGDADGLGATMMPPGSLTVMGQLWLVGRSVERRARLAASAAAGSTVLRVRGATEGWSVGDDVVITSSSYEPAETETRKVASIQRANGTTALTLDSGLTHDHDTEVESFPGHPGIETSPYVAVLTRSVRIVGADLTDAETQRVSNNVAADNDAFRAAGSPERRRPSPLETLRATETDQYGCRVHVTREAKDECVDYEGGAVIHNVEFSRCGHGSQFAQGISGEALVFSNLGSRPAPPAATSVEVQGSAFRWLYHGGIHSASSKKPLSAGMGIHNNTVYRSVGSGIKLASASTHATGNLVAWVVFPGTHNGLALFEDISMPAGVEVMASASDTAVVRDNAVYGSERAGFKAHLPACGAASGGEARWHSNEATAVGYGVWSYLEPQRSCMEVRGFTIARAWEFGILAVTPSSQTHVLDTRVIGAGAGAAINVFRPPALSHRYAGKQVLYRRSLFVGTPSSGSCAAGADVAPAKRWRWTLTPKPSMPRAGLWQSIFTSGPPDSLEMAPPWSVASYGALGGGMVVEDTVFARFNDHTASCGRVDKAVSTNKVSAQVSHPVSFSGIRWYDVSPASRLLIHRPVDSNINPEDCVQSHCQGLKSLIFHDLDGTFLFGRDEALPLPGVGDPVPGTGTLPSPTKPSGRTFTILGNTGFTNSKAWGDILPIPLQFRANGSVVEEDHLARRRGVAFDPSHCVERADWAADAKASPSACAHTGGRYRFLIVESMDPDTETRNLGPVAFLGTGRNGVSHPDDRTEALGRDGNAPSSALQLVNSQMDVTWASGWTGLRRLSTFWAPVATPYHYTVYFQGTNPQSTRLRLADASATEGVVVSLWYSDPQKLAVFVGGQRVHDINWESSDVYKGKNNPSYIDQFPGTSSPVGTNAYFRLARTIHVTVRGNQPVDIRTLPVVQVSLTMAVSVEAFFDEQDAFVERLAFVLNIPNNRIRVVSIVPGSTKVDFEIEPDPALLESDSTDGGSGSGSGSGGGDDDDGDAGGDSSGGGLTTTDAAVASLADVQNTITDMAINGSLQDSLNVSIEAMVVVPPPPPPRQPPPPPTNAEEDKAYRDFLEEQGGSVTDPEDLERIRQDAMAAAAPPELRDDAVSLGRGEFSLVDHSIVVHEAAAAPEVAVLRESGTFGSEPVTVDVTISPATQAQIDAVSTASGSRVVAAPASSVDVSGSSATLTFERGESKKSTRLLLLGDQVYEFPPPAVYVALSNAQGGAKMGRVAEGVVVVEQGASQQARAVVDASAVKLHDVADGHNGTAACVVTDDSGFTTITVRRVLSTGLSASNDATAVLALLASGSNNTASPFSDFLNNPVSVRFEPGETEVTVKLPVLRVGGKGALPFGQAEPLELSLVALAAGNPAAQASLGWRNLNATATPVWSFCALTRSAAGLPPAGGNNGPVDALSIALLAGVGVGVLCAVVVLGVAVFVVQRCRSPEGKRVTHHKYLQRGSKQASGDDAVAVMASASGATSDTVSKPARLPTLSSAHKGGQFSVGSPMHDSGSRRASALLPEGAASRMLSLKSNLSEHKTSSRRKVGRMKVKAGKD